MTYRTAGPQSAQFAQMFTQPGKADAVIRTLFCDRAIAYVPAYGAADGCCAARIGRYEEEA